MTTATRQPAAQPVTIDLVDYAAEVGSYVVPDGKSFGECLLPGDDYVDEGFAGCDFRYPCPVFGKDRAIAVNVYVTSRKLRWRQGGWWVRVKLEWVGDCEENTYTSGWMKV